MTANVSEPEEPPGPTSELVDLYRELRVGRPASLGQLAIRTGLSKSHLSEVFNGRKVPSPDTSQRIAEALGATPDTALRARLHAERLADMNRHQRRNGASPAEGTPLGGSPREAQHTSGGHMINNYGIVHGNVSIQSIQVWDSPGL